MRISIEHDSPWFIGFEHGNRWEVFLDKQRLFECIEADNVAGWVRVPKRDAAGQLVMEHGRVVSEKRYGRVHIVDLYAMRPQVKPWPSVQ